MSGIVGIWNRDGAPVSRALLQRMTDALAFRGPDGQETWDAGPVGLGNTALRAYRRSGVEKLSSSLEGKFWITADARIDCRQDLAIQLQRAGRTASALDADCDLVLQSYAAWGEDCVDVLRGDFAFAIWDSEKRKMFCARDHFGIRPFYYLDRSGIFALSNTLNCLRMHPRVSGELNEQAVADFLLFGLNTDNHTTFFANILRLPPGHCLAVSTEKLELRKYWSPPTGGRIRFKRDEEYIEQFSSLLTSAVAERMPQDSLGILLSGGLDSGSLAAIAAEIATSAAPPVAVNSYTSVFEKLLPDNEGEFAQRTARYLKIPNHQFKLDGLFPFARLDDPNFSTPEPVDSPFFAGAFDEFRVIAERTRVVFSGEGCDNLMNFEMWPYAKSLRDSGEWKGYFQQVAKYVRVRRFPWRGIKARMRSSFRASSAKTQLPPWIRTDFAQRMGLAERLATREGSLAGPDAHLVVPEGHASLSLPDWTALFEQQNAGVTRQPVEVSYPYMDLRVVEFLLAIPPFPWFYEKKLLRDAMRGRIPEEVRLRRKTPLAGEAISAHMGQVQGVLGDSTWSPEIDLYIDGTLLTPLHGKMNAEQLVVQARPRCLNLWLQCAQSADYKLDSETLNG